MKKRKDGNYEMQMRQKNRNAEDISFQEVLIGGYDKNAVLQYIIDCMDKFDAAENNYKNEISKFQKQLYEEKSKSKQIDENAKMQKDKNEHLELELKEQLKNNREMDKKVKDIEKKIEELKEEKKVLQLENETIKDIIEVQKAALNDKEKQLKSENEKIIALYKRVESALIELNNSTEDTQIQLEGEE